MVTEEAITWSLYEKKERSCCHLERGSILPYFLTDSSTETMEGVSEMDQLVQ